MTHWEHSVKPGNSNTAISATLDFADHNRQNSAQNGVLQRGRHAADTFANVTQRTRRSERTKERIIELIERTYHNPKQCEHGSFVWTEDIIELIRRQA